MRLAAGREAGDGGEPSRRAGQRGAFVECPPDTAPRLCRWVFIIGLPEVYSPRCGNEEIEAVRSVTRPRSVCVWSRSPNLSIHLFMEVFAEDRSLCRATAPMSVSGRSARSVTRTKAHTPQALRTGTLHDRPAGQAGAAPRACFAASPGMFPSLVGSGPGGGFL